MSKPIITICSSANFYRQAVDVQGQLIGQGLEAIVPNIATKMKETGDYEVSNYKTWFADAADYYKKAELMRAHFDKIAAADAILVVNFEKHGVQNYIGANVLMEMALAFYLKKKIFILNELPEKSAFEEEILGMQPIVLHGDVTRLKEQL